MKNLRIIELFCELCGRKELVNKNPSKIIEVYWNDCTNEQPSDIKIFSNGWIECIDDQINICANDLIGMLKDKEPYLITVASISGGKNDPRKG